MKEETVVKYNEKLQLNISKNVPGEVMLYITVQSKTNSSISYTYRVTSDKVKSENSFDIYTGVSYY